MDSSPHAAATADFIQEWMEKADKQFCNDPQLRTALIGCFEALKCINTNDTAQYQYLMNTMPIDREAAVKFDDKMNADRHRQFVYGIHGCIEKVIESQMKRPRDGEVMAIEGPKEVEGMSMDEALRFPKFNGRMEDNVMQNQPSTSGGSMHHTPLIAQRSLTTVLRKVTNEITPRKKGAIRGRPSGGKSIRTLNCPMLHCMEGGMHISGFVSHLKKAHNTTPGAARIGFKCTCGFAANSYMYVWNHANACRTCELSLFDRSVADGDESSQGEKTNEDN